MTSRMKRRKHLLKEFLKTFGFFPAPPPPVILSPLEEYEQGGRFPFTPGYPEYRQQFIERTLGDPTMLAVFQTKRALPAGFGLRLDERVIEYPWIFSRLDERPGLLLDAGSTLNFPFLLQSPRLQQKTLIIYTLAPETVFPSAQISYLYGDLRSSVLKDTILDTIICISTLEHIGMDNAVYTQDEQFHVRTTESDLSVLAEFRRMLKPGGDLFITIPYGQRQNFGWFEQFDHAKLDQAIRVFGGTICDQAFYKYDLNGWQIADAAACAEQEYSPSAWCQADEPDYAVAARAVACLHLMR
jgi:hypothetical protein